MKKKDRAKLGLKKKKDESVRVIVRVRPIFGREKTAGNYSIVDVNPDKASVQIRKPDTNEPPKVFTFDATFDPRHSQRDIYDQGAAVIVDGVLEGYNGTVFAYGQTGAGKSHTMQGPAERKVNPELNGIIPNSFEHIFQYVTVNSGPLQKFMVRASYLEIYNEQVRDLLGKDPEKKLAVKSSPKKGIFVQGLSEHTVSNVADIDRVQNLGEANRSVGSTDMNAVSSRSHSIFCIVIERMTTNETTKEDQFRKGKLNLVDLAGSERIAKTGATGTRMAEGIKINQSLSALGNVIAALTSGKSGHIPYRDSVLTRLLQDSLGGNTKTVLCANCGPADYNYDETLGTLRFAKRAKMIKNKPIINEDPKDALLRDLQSELENLRKQLAAAANGSGPIDPAAIAERARKKKEKKEKKAKEKREKKRRLLQPKKIIKEEVEGLTKEEFEKRKAEQEKERLELEEQARKELEEEMREIKRNETKAQRIARELQEQQERDQQIKEQQEMIKKKMQDMERQMFLGEKLKEKAAKTAMDIRAKQLKEVKLREEQMIRARELAEQEERVSALVETYNSLEEEVTKKTEKLHKIITKYQAIKDDIAEMHDDHRKDKDRLMKIRHDLDAQCKLKNLIIKNYLPANFVKAIEKNMEWDSRLGEWGLKQEDESQNFLLPKRPRHLIGLQRPTSSHSLRMALRHRKPRHRMTNVVDLDFDYGENLTKNYDSTKREIQHKRMLNDALDGEMDEVVDASDMSARMTYSGSGSQSSSGRRTRPKSARHKRH